MTLFNLILENCSFIMSRFNSVKIIIRLHAIIFTDCNNESFNKNIKDLVSDDLLNQYILRASFKFKKTEVAIVQTKIAAILKYDTFTLNDVLQSVLQILIKVTELLNNSIKSFVNDVEEAETSKSFIKALSSQWLTELKNNLTHVSVMLF